METTLININRIDLFRINKPLFYCAIFIGVILFFSLQSCLSIPITQEVKHPSMFLLCKTKVICMNDSNYFIDLKIKNKAKKTSYKNMDVLIQVYNVHGDSACFISRRFNSPILKPHHRQTILMPLFCPGQIPQKATINNLYGTPVISYK